MSDTPRTDEMAQGWDEGLAMPSEILCLCRELERELNEQTLVNGKGSEREAALLAKVERLERENAALLRQAVEVLMIGRAWITVWGDKLSPASIEQFTTLENQILKLKETKS